MFARSTTDMCSDMNIIAMTRLVETGELTAGVVAAKVAGMPAAAAGGAGRKESGC